MNSKCFWKPSNHIHDWELNPAKMPGVLIDLRITHVPRRTQQMPTGTLDAELWLSIQNFGSNSCLQYSASFSCHIIVGSLHRQIKMTEFNKPTRHSQWSPVSVDRRRCSCYSKAKFDPLNRASSQWWCCCASSFVAHTRLVRVRPGAISCRNSLRSLLQLSDTPVIQACNRCTHCLTKAHIRGYDIPWQRVVSYYINECTCTKTEYSRSV